MANRFTEAISFPTKPEPRQESDRDQIATIIQRGHIGHKTSDEIAREVILHVNRTLRPDRDIQSLTDIDP